MKRILWIAAAILALAGCSNNDDSNPLDATVPGVYQSLDADSLALIAPSGLSFFLSGANTEAPELVRVGLGGPAATLTGGARHYAVTGSGLNFSGPSDGSGSFTGQYTVAEDTHELTGTTVTTVNNTATTTTINYTMERDTLIDTQDIGVATLAGTWADSGATTSITVTSTGDISGSDNDDCTYTGKATLPVATLNIYDLNLTVSCPSLATQTVQGIATHLVGDSFEFLVVGFGNDSVGLLVQLSKQPPPT